MFRFSIRELSLAMLAVTMGIAWTAERSRVAASLAETKHVKAEAKEQIDEAGEQADSWQRRCSQLESAWQDSEVELDRHGLALFGFCGNPDAVLCRRNQDGTYVTVNIDPEPSPFQDPSKD